MRERVWVLSTTLAVAGLLLLTGCSNTLQVTYYSDPPGAVLYQGQQRFGYMPQTLRYRLSEADLSRGYVQVQGTSVRWASGATAEVTSLTADLNRNRLSQQFTFNRPEGYPGREADVRFALELERLRIMQRQAAAQEQLALWQMFNAINQQYQRPSMTNCTSTLFGNIINTTCY